jgi:hypothetical protein
MMRALRALGIASVILMIRGIVAAQDTPVPGLNGLYVSNDGVLSVQYPSNWFIADRSNLPDFRNHYAAFFSDQETGLLTSLPLGDSQSGEAGIDEVAVAMLVIDPELIDIDPAEPAMLLRQIVELAQAEGSAVSTTYSQPEHVVLQSQPAAYINYVVRGAANDVDGRIYASAYDNNKLGLFVAVAPETQANLLPTAYSVIESVRYRPPPELTETFTSDDGLLTIRYPEGWQVSSNSLKGIVGALDISTTGPLMPEDVGILVTIFDEPPVSYNERTPEGILDGYRAHDAITHPDIVWGDPWPNALSRHDSAGHNHRQREMLRRTYIVVYPDGRVGLLSFAAHEAYFRDYLSTAHAMIDSLGYGGR